MVWRYRTLLLLVLSLCGLSLVSAVSITVPESMKAAYSMEVGDQIVFDFVLRGDAQVESVQFFMKTDSGNVVFNGEKNDVLSFTLQPFQERNISVVMKAVKQGSASVAWGYSYVASGGAMMNQVIQKRFSVNVYAVPVQNNSSGTRRSSGGGGGGGGGGLMLQVNDSGGQKPASDAVAAVGSPSEKAVDSGVQMQDVNGGDEGFAQMQVAGQDTVVPSVQAEVTVAKEKDNSGRMMLGVFIGSLVIFFILQVSTLKIYKGVSS
jgi:hypothetical protein